MQQRFTAAQSNDASFEVAQKLDAMNHRFQRHRLGKIVVFVAVGTRQITAPDGDNVRHDGVASISGSLGHEFYLPHSPIEFA
jgi:hypothetical protein